MKKALGLNARLSGFETDNKKIFYFESSIFTKKSGAHYACRGFPTVFRLPLAVLYTQKRKDPAYTQVHKELPLFLSR